jgi:hypothetical protein
MADAIHGLAEHLFAVGQRDMIGGKPAKAVRRAACICEISYRIDFRERRLLS